MLFLTSPLISPCGAGVFASFVETVGEVTGTTNNSELLVFISTLGFLGKIVIVSAMEAINCRNAAASISGRHSGASIQ